MRKLCSLLLFIIFSLLCITAATAETQTFSIKELPGVTSSRWEQTYEAYGRTIRVNTDIVIPDMEQIPLLAVQPMEPLPEEEVQKYEEMFSTPYSSKFLNDKYRTYISFSDHEGHPDLSNAEKVTTPNRPLYEYDRNKAYTEDNDLTVAEAENLVRENIQKVFPGMDFRVDKIVINDRTKYRKSGKKLEAKGYYELDCAQVIDGVPVAGSIHNAYRNGRTKHDRIIGNYGTASAAVTDEGNFYGRYSIWNTTAELGTPDQFLPFDAVRPKIEDMIMSGNIRHVFSVNLGYAQYDLPEGSKYEYILVPAWVVCAGWMDEPEEEDDGSTSVNGSDYAMGCTYLPIIVNAVTGEVTNPLDESVDRMLLPASWMQWVEE